MNNSGAAAGSKWLLVGLGVLIALIGLGLAGGGGYLVSLGGSGYFLLMGLAMLVSGLLIARRDPRGAWIYGVALVLTAIWAVWDTGLEYWPLVSRVLTFAVIGLVVALVYPTLVRASGATAGRGAYGLAGVLGLGVVATLAYMFVPTHVVKASVEPAVTPVVPGTEQKDWAHWGNTTAGNRFAALDQINKGNIDKLQVAWTFRTGDIPESNGSGAEDQNTPLQVGDNIYVCTAYGKVFSLDADTGAERWKFDPKGSAPNWQRCRGLGYFDSSSAATGTAQPVAASACVKRLFLPTIDARLIAIDAETGKPCADFGDQGTVDLKTDMGEVKPGYYQQTSTPLVAGNVVIVGGRVADNFSTGEPPGVVRAFDVRSGELVWAWDPGNPNTTKRPPAGETYTRGTPNVWSAMSYDPKLGLVYLPTGNATPDFFAGERTEFDDKWSSSIVALDVATGQVRWHFQTTHHDLWDFDLPAQPLLYDVPDDKGGVQPALAQVTKQGEIFLLNRETGKPIARVEERPVPQGNVPGERYSPTQPFSVEMPSIGNQTLTEADMWGATPFDQLMCRIQFKGMRHQGVYTPPGLDRALQFPGSLGGMNWGSVSVDPNTHYMFVNDMRLGLANYMIPRDKIAAGASGIEMGVVPQAGTPFGAMRERFLSAAGIPCQKPPFGTMSAIDLKTRKLMWQVPVGTVQDTGPMGIRMHMQIPIGMPTLGASLATQSGLLFFAGTQDFYLRAFDTGNGNEIWKSRLPVGSQSGPMTYVSPKTGQQYILLTAGGARQSTDRGDYVIAYALPK
ncbi:glucose/quinate/shikimate family membrane-bound PQQ-dependent dehydrogenase [Pseudomonas sp. MF4836]|uniref:glucose/quinate/shikimate family membrane-bound PQQ-dependent dehydrogenase n=1 Tax=Pseudomonas sp. MF4836 TaxID=1960827 RepID=UPI000997DB10|nr:glucose/quinate/shikimate family membrane-bound PQQ-dependent dehydrogenase [Pseudomonas sp. MF4836]OOV91767.1 membrane-bound PQQ-dependent dehydrogenase, glucose/quinate/shikimate family [Pseudomonas sp. MF4836]